MIETTIQISDSRPAVHMMGRSWYRRIRKVVNLVPLRIKGGPEMGMVIAISKGSTRIAVALTQDQTTLETYAVLLIQEGVL